MDSSLFDISGRVALIAGASRGIGRGIAEGLCQAGATIALSSRKEADLLQVAEDIRARGGCAEVFPADLSSVAQIQTAIAADPDSVFLLEQLRRTYDRRLQLTQRAVTG